MRAKLFFAFVFILFTALAGSANAVSVSIISVPQTLSQDSFILTASISGASAGTNYLRVDIYKDGTENYFGETFGSGGFYSGSNYTNYLPITIQSGVYWQGNIQAKVGSPSVTEYDGTGNYKIRIRRYTESGGTNASEANAGAVSVAVSIPTSTPTPAPPTATPKITPINTPIPTATPAKSQSVTNALKPTSKTIAKSSPGVLGDNITKVSPTKEPAVKILSDTQDSGHEDTNFIPKVFISVGIVFLILCGIVISYPFFKKMKDKNINE